MEIKSMSDLLKITFFFFFMFCYGSSGCIPTEREALLEFKNKLKDPSNRLHSWDINIGDGDCCQWYGVICSNFSSHVLELHLQSLSMSEYFGYDEHSYHAYREYYSLYDEKSAFGGEISSSLLNLKHLRYLDLSHNNFEVAPIPKFLGSLRSLRSLNLYGARFGGFIPHELGNLSNLVYLNLNGAYDFYGFYSLSIDSFDWLSSGLSLLEFLDLSSVDFSQSDSFHLFEVMSKLPSLVELHLSDCHLVHIPPQVNLNFSSLSVLDLTSNSFLESSIPDWVFRLKNLKTLNLSFNQFEAPLNYHLQNMTSLQELDLSSNRFPLIPKWIFRLRNLISLKVGSNSIFQGPIPSELQNVSSIEELDLSYNGFNSSIPDFLYDFRHLKVLNFGYNSLSGKISGSIQNMTSLTNLDLSRNVKFEGGIPKSFQNLCILESLSFSGTELGQEMNEILNILSGCSSNLLESLDLSSCKLSGKLTNNLSKLKNLIDLRLSDNSISGPIPLTLAELKSLRFLLLDHNKFGGTVPEALGELAKLEDIDISYNLLEGLVSEMHFANLTNLRTFDGSMNQLIRLTVRSDWIPPFLHLQVLKLGGLDIGDQFPSWFHTLKYVKILDLSNSRISSTIPNWFLNSSFQFTYLNLSHNQISGAIPDINITSDVIDLSSNLFEGSLPRISSNTRFLDFSNNSFSGSISHFICDKMDEEKQMSVLDLGNNLLSGEIPDCWSNNWIFLSSLRLSSNNFSGNIPKSIGNLTRLDFLHLWNNSLSGELPMSLQNCFLNTLDLGKNELTGHIPSWIPTSFLSMSILILGGNKFHGKIPNEICQLSSLQILDLSYNSLSGDIPKCINNFTFMAIADSPDQSFSFMMGSGDGGDVSVIDDATIMMKGRMVEYESILQYVRIMDFSSNNLSGEIPKEITRLVKLQSLNLSNNFLSRDIPEDIGDMTGLEALDLSRNRLNGRIPQSMTSLTFLSILNLSYNNLSGMIPTGTQLQSFPSSSFVGNGGLRGPPLTDNSTPKPNGSVPPSGENENEEDKVDWGLYVSMAVGFIVGFWSILCPLFLNRRWRRSYYLFLYNLWNRILWHFRCYGG